MSVPKLRFKTDKGKEFPAWNTKKLSDVANVYDGVHQTPDYQKAGIKFISVEDIDDIESSDKYISKEAYIHDFKVKAKNGDIFMTRIGSIGKATQLKTDEDIAYYVSLALIKCKDVNAEYLLHFIDSSYFQRELWNRTLHEAYPQKINKGDIGLCNILVPQSDFEQQKIADFFSTLDQIIDKTQAEVDAWEKQKQGMMQKLFSQEIRFKADDGSEYPEWEVKALGDIAHQLSKSIDPQSYSDVVFTEYSMPAFDNGQADEMHGYEMKSTRKVLSEPCVLINKLNVRKKRIWIIEHPENNAVCSAEFIPVASEKMSLKFLGHYALTDSFTNYLLDCSSGSSNSQKRVTPDIIMNMTIPNPCIEEQQKIADCLSAFDSVIDKTKQELETYKQLKKGLMQQMFV